MVMALFTIYFFFFSNGRRELVENNRLEYMSLFLPLIIFGAWAVMAVFFDLISVVTDFISTPPNCSCVTVPEPHPSQKLELDTAKRVKHLSPGQQKKLQMVIAMTGDPDFYILDEPTLSATV